MSITWLTLAGVPGVLQGEYRVLARTVPFKGAGVSFIDDGFFTPGCQPRRRDYRGEITREMAVGNGPIDLLVTCNGLRLALELKIKFDFIHRFYCSSVQGYGINFLKK